MNARRLWRKFFTQKSFKQRGQMLVLFALMIPLVILPILGLALDLGWYYLNVSRLQNAADAAALAGAKKMMGNDPFAEHKYTWLVENNSYQDENVKPFTISETDETKKENQEATIAAGNATAQQYANKNLSGDSDTAVDQWTKNTVAPPTTAFFTKGDGKFVYYVVNLTEEIEHFFLPGWFNDMDAPVTAVAILSKTPKDDNGGGGGDDPDDPELTDEDTEILEEAKNKNVIVGNWEVQNYYRSINTKDGTETKVLVDDDGNPILDKNGNTQIVKLTRAEEYSGIYTSDYDKIIGITREVYTNAWSKFQDYKVHFKSGTPIRYEIIDVFDDVKLVDPNLTGKDRYANNNMASYGKTDNGNVKNATANGSSVQQNKASGNSLDSSSYTYNKDGNPYAWQDLDSIDIDFQPEVGWDKANSVYPLQDWDLKFGYDKWSDSHADGTGNSNVGVGAILHHAYGNDGSELSTTKKGGWQNHLRIHSYINFKTPYPARSTYEKSDSNDTDALWVRIESEPMFRYPDSKDSRKQTKNHLDIGGLNSVRQIIINFTESNIDSDGNEYRPIVIFYDGPERYSTNNSIRDSQPIIVNFAAPVRAIIYVPNSPVVVIGDHKDDFQGFIVAKKYLRLKNTKDFEDELDLYEKTNDTGIDKNGYIIPGDNYRAKETVDNSYYGTKHTRADGIVVNYRDNGEPKTINWMYKKITYNPTKRDGSTVVGAFDMYVDDYGNVQYMDYPDAPKLIGTYSTLGKTDLTTHNYQINQTSSVNMLLSGVKFNYETNNSSDGDIRYKGTRVF